MGVPFSSRGIYRRAREQIPTASPETQNPAGDSVLIITPEHARTKRDERHKERKTTVMWGCVYEGEIEQITKSERPQETRFRTAARHRSRYLSR